MSLFLKRWSALEKSRADRFLDIYCNLNENIIDYYYKIKDSRITQMNFFVLFGYLGRHFANSGNDYIATVINDIFKMYPDFLSKIHIDSETEDSFGVTAQSGSTSMKLIFRFSVSTIIVDSIFLDAHLMNLGLGKEIFSRLIPFCRKYNIRTMDLIAIYVGRYAWARFGFTARGMDLKNQKKFLKILYLGNFNMQIKAMNHTAEIAAARIEITDEYIAQLRRKRKYKDMWGLLISHIVEKNPIFWANNQFLIGKWSLLGGIPMDEDNLAIEYPVRYVREGWEGTLHLDDSKDMRILGSYIQLTEAEEHELDASFFRDIPNALCVRVTEDLDEEEEYK